MQDLDTTTYVCVACQPVSEWYDLDDDPWAYYYEKMVRQARESLEWLGGDYLADALIEYIDDETWQQLVDGGLADKLREAIDRMVDAKVLSQKIHEMEKQRR